MRHLFLLWFLRRTISLPCRRFLNPNSSFPEYRIPIHCLKISLALELNAIPHKNTILPAIEFTRDASMPRSRILFFFLLLLLMAGLAMPAAAQSGIQVVSDAASLTFPNSIILMPSSRAGQYHLRRAGIRRDQFTCGTVNAELSRRLLLAWTSK